MTTNHEPKVALITGVTGQDGAYLAELLLAKGYTVHGIKRRASSFNTQRIDHLYVDPHADDPRLVLHYGDMTDATNLIRIVQEVQPDEIYNLAAMPDGGRERSGVRPGITGWAQVHGGQLLGADAKLALDLWYVRHASPGLDARILALTLRMVLQGDRVDAPAVERAKAFLQSA